MEGTECNVSTSVWKRLIKTTLIIATKQKLVGFLCDRNQPILLYLIVNIRKVVRDISLL